MLVGAGLESFFALRLLLLLVLLLDAMHMGHGREINQDKHKQDSQEMLYKRHGLGRLYFFCNLPPLPTLRGSHGHG